MTMGYVISEWAQVGTKRSKVVGSDELNTRGTDDKPTPLLPFVVLTASAA